MDIKDKWCVGVGSVGSGYPVADSSENGSESSASVKARTLLIKW